jgi:carboxymethylenebutenolidase
MELTTDTPHYTEGITGYFARPKEGGNGVGIVLIHEWWGLNDQVKKQAEKLAQEGYLVLAVDLYGKSAETREEAQALKEGLTDEQAIRNMKDAVAFLRNNGAEKIVSWGWCFGGKQSLALALSGEKLNATVIYYGHTTDNKEALSKISWPIFGAFGEEDKSVTPESARAFDTALTELNIPHEVHIYEGAGHAFGNETGPNYNPEATEDAWDKTLAFLNTYLK